MNLDALPETVFEEVELGPGFRLYCYPTTQFKNTTVALYQHNELGPDCSALALLPPVLSRGSENHPDMQRIAMYMEELYGASFDDDLLKLGEHQTMELRLTLLNDRYALGGEPLLQDGMRFLSDILTRPATENGRLREAVFELERENLVNFLRSIYDDKDSYAREQANKLMFKDEEYVRFEYGDEASLAALTPESLTDVYRRRLAESPVDLFVLGEVDPAAVAKTARECFQLPRGKVRAIAPDTVHPTPAAETVVFEKQALEQGKLVMTFATPVIACEQDHFPMSLFSAVLGGFPSSKLFVNVREKESLCYYATAQYNPFKGHVSIRSGIAPENYEKARAAILEEMRKMREGDITDRELSDVKTALLHHLTVSIDSPSAMIGRAVSNRISGLNVSYRETAERIAAVTRDQIAAAANLLVPDTTYFLSSREK